MRKILGQKNGQIDGKEISLSFLESELLQNLKMTYLSRPLYLIFFSSFDENVILFSFGKDFVKSC